MYTEREHRLKVCVHHVKGSRLPYRIRIRDWFCLRFFPWFYRKILYKHIWCYTTGCPHWQWATGDTSPNGRGFCSIADGRMIKWAQSIRDDPNISRPY